ncbi:MAG TPA: HPr family phosphocarrier protein [Ktedonobacterales bacterium]|nr:HPr family phosphocarrier protein [Ktedonobacterales bacterium]
MTTVERAVILSNKVGLHARPASLLVQTASRFSASVVLTANGRSADAKRILQVLQLGAECGVTVSVRGEGEDAPEAVAAIEALILQRFNEPE